MLTLSRRLQRVADYVEKYSPKPVYLADVGSDHAYLPIYLVQNGTCHKALAGEVVQGPYEASKANVTSYGLTGDIDVVLADGLDLIKGNELINTVTICGMGGTLISQILESGRAYLNPSTILVLQSNIASEHIRQWFNDNKVKLIDESVMKDGKHFYEFIVGVYQPEENIPPLNEKEVIFGPCNLKKPSQDFIQLWKREGANIEKIINQLKSTENSPANLNRYQALNHKLKLIKEVVD